MKILVSENEELVTWIRTSEYTDNPAAIDISDEEWKEYNIAQQTCDRLLGIFRDRDRAKYQARLKR
jgi:hypothetical protein